MRPALAVPVDTEWHWRVWLACAGVAFGAWLLWSQWTPPAEPSWSVCLFRRLTHHECATCGMTRAMAALAKGDVAGSIARHPLALPLAVEAALLWLAAPLVWRRVITVTGAQRDRWLVGHAVVLIVVWVARSLA